MLYTKSTSGELVPITNGGVYAVCPKCGKTHVVDLVGMLEEHLGDIEGYSAYCEECSKKHLPMFENADKLQSIADWFEVPLTEVQQIAQSGLDRDLSFEACLTGARMILSMKTGKHELFSLDDAAAALGCTREEAAEEMKKRGVDPMKLSTLPEFEWLLEKMTLYSRQKSTEPAEKSSYQPPRESK